MLFPPAHKQRPRRAERDAAQNDVHHVHPEHAGGDKRRGHDEVGEDAFLLHDAASHVPHDGRDDRADAGLHPGEHLADNEIVAEQRVEIRDHRDDEKRWQDRREDRDQHTRHARKLVSHDDRAVDRDCSRSGLRDGDQIEHFLVLDPVQLIDKFPLQKRHDHVAAAKCKRAEIQRGKKELPQHMLSAFHAIASAH